ncbi:hypothetical protein ALC53_14012 [Atta colombica]|uniref:Uncharacterized protein n=1 Tax=Atta colombica TaxID=520822 RepID=A0A195AUC5_9HYME|nr:hypothetical protein ALC53_14012 [Atta colombica]
MDLRSRENSSVNSFFHFVSISCLTTIAPARRSKPLFGTPNGLIFSARTIKAVSVASPTFSNACLNSYKYTYVTPLRLRSQVLFLLELYKAHVFFKNENSRLADIQMRYQAHLRGQSIASILLGNLFFGHPIFIFRINVINIVHHEHRSFLIIVLHSLRTSLIKSNERIIISPGNGMLRSKCKHLRDANENTGERDGSTSFRERYFRILAIPEYGMHVLFSVPRKITFTKQTNANKHEARSDLDLISDDSDLDRSRKRSTRESPNITRATSLSGLTRIGPTYVKS